MKRNRKARVNPLYEAKHGFRHCRDGRLCVECGDPLTGRQQRWCGQPCVTTYKIRQGGKEARQEVYKRDRGICGLCGLDTKEILALVKRADTRGLETWAQDLARGVALARLHQYRWKGRRLGRRLPAKPREGTQPWHKLRERKLVLGLLGLGLESYAWRKSFWDMDHVVAVRDGGAQCGLADLRTLCLPCHGARTRKQNSGPRKRRARRLPRLSGERCMGCTEVERCLGCLRYRKRVLGRS